MNANNENGTTRAPFVDFARRIRVKSNKTNETAQKDASPLGQTTSASELLWFKHLLVSNTRSFPRKTIYLRE